MSEVLLTKRKSLNSVLDCLDTFGIDLEYFNPFGFGGLLFTMQLPASSVQVHVLFAPRGKQLRMEWKAAQREIEMSDTEASASEEASPFLPTYSNFALSVLALACLALEFHICTMYWCV